MNFLTFSPEEKPCSCVAFFLLTQFQSVIMRQTGGLKQSLNYNPSCILSVMTFFHKQLKIVYASDLSVPWTQ